MLREADWGTASLEAQEKMGMLMEEEGRNRNALARGGQSLTHGEVRRGEEGEREAPELERDGREERETGKPVGEQGEQGVEVTCHKGDRFPRYLQGRKGT